MKFIITLILLLVSLTGYSQNYIPTLPKVVDNAILIDSLNYNTVGYKDVDINIYMGDTIIIKKALRDKNNIELANEIDYLYWNYIKQCILATLIDKDNAENDNYYYIRKLTIYNNQMDIILSVDTNTLDILHKLDYIIDSKKGLWKN